jgi:hypothetical protein
MLDVVGGFVLVVTLFALVVLLLFFADGWHRRRLDVVHRQIALTEAIHRELGAVVAPVLERDGRRSWCVLMTVPVDCLRVVERVLSIVDASFAPGSYAVVLRPCRGRGRISSIDREGRAGARRPPLATARGLLGSPAA